MFSDEIFDREGNDRAFGDRGHDAEFPSGNKFDRFIAHSRSEDPVECGRGAAALYVGEVGLTALEPKVHVVQLRRELAHRNGVTFRDDDDAVFLAASLDRKSVV